MSLSTDKTKAAVVTGVALAGLAAWAIKLRRSADWERTLEFVTHGVVVVRVSSVMAFDMNDAGFSLATGFVVDAKLGIIMTNRHVVTTGPVTADAVFLNKEEVELTPLYADPVHDFGFFRYDPSQIQFMQISQIALRPEAARVGLEVRVVGNDAGEKISILSGTLARLDRAAPNYGSHTYNDFNTFYYSCASNTSGGSSGSPVINSRGEAIALNAGTSTKSASSYYLPLERPRRALRLLQKALLRAEAEGSEFKGARAAIPRGSLCAVFVHKAFGELRRLGLDAAVEKGVRHAMPSETGMLVVDQVVPGGPAVGVLQPGDVMLAIEPCAASDAPLEGGAAPEVKLSRVAWCTAFLQMEAVLDECVDGHVWLSFMRGGAALKRRLPVQDLHALSPTSQLEAGGCCFHSLSYQQARNWNLPPGSVHAAFAGYMLSNAGVPSRAIIREINHRPTPTLEAVRAVLESLHDGARVPMRFVLPHSHHQERLAVIAVERTWFAMARYELQPATGRWTPTKSPPPPPPPPPLPKRATFALVGPKMVRAVTPSLVRVYFDIPYQIDGVAGLKYVGAGLVVDAALGIVLVDRNTVPVGLGDVRVEFASTVEVQATVRFLHPTHNFALVQYRTDQLDNAPPEGGGGGAGDGDGDDGGDGDGGDDGDDGEDDETVVRTCTRVASAEISSSPLGVGEECMFVGLPKLDAALPFFQQCVVRETCVMEVGLANVPRFRAVNEEVVRFDLGLSLEDTIGGVFVDAAGRVKAIWAAYCNCAVEDELFEQFEGLNAQLAIPAIAQLQTRLRTGCGGAAADDDNTTFPTAETAVAAAAATPPPSSPPPPSPPPPSPSPLHLLEAELRPLSLSTACGTSEGSGLGLPREWADRLSRCPGAAAEKRQALSVLRLLPGSGAAAALQEGDLILAVDGVPVNTFSALEAAVQPRPQATLTLLREGAVLADTHVGCTRVASDTTDHLVMWCGLILQAAYRAVLERGFAPPEGGVYISYYLFGSPAHKYKLVPKHWLVELNGESVSGLDAFVRMVQKLPHGANVRCKTCDLTGKVGSYTLKTDHHYWRGYEVRCKRGEGAAFDAWTLRSLAEPAA